MLGENAAFAAFALGMIYVARRRRRSHLLRAIIERFYDDGDFPSGSKTMHELLVKDMLLAYSKESEPVSKEDFGKVFGRVLGCHSAVERMLGIKLPSSEQTEDLGRCNMIALERCLHAVNLLRDNSSDLVTAGDSRAYVAYFPCMPASVQRSPFEHFIALRKVLPAGATLYIEDFVSTCKDTGMRGTSSRCSRIQQLSAFVSG